MMAGSAPVKRTAKKRPAAQPASTGTVVLDLDALEKSQVFPDVPAELFKFRLGGRDYELRDPRDTDWKMALRLVRNPFLLMRTALVGADDPVDDPTDGEREAAIERLGLEHDGAASAGIDQAEVVVTLLDRFTAAELYGWKLSALFDNWHKHYKIDLSDDKGALAALLGTGD